MSKKSLKQKVMYTLGTGVLACTFAFTPVATTSVAHANYDTWNDIAQAIGKATQIKVQYDEVKRQIITWSNNVYKACLPETIQNIMKQVKKLSGTGGGSSSGTQTTNDYAFLLAEIEIFGTTTYSVSGEGSQYQYFKNATSNRYKKPVYNTYNSARWWERSPRSGSSYNFCIVNSNGRADNDGASYAYGLAPCFCI